MHSTYMVSGIVQRSDSVTFIHATVRYDLNATVYGVNACSFMDALYIS